MRTCVVLNFFEPYCIINASEIKVSNAGRDGKYLAADLDDGRGRGCAAMTRLVSSVCIVSNYRGLISGAVGIGWRKGIPKIGICIRVARSDSILLRLPPVACFC